MEYTVPLRITVQVDNELPVIAAAKAEIQRAFDVSDEEWEATEQPYIEQHFAHALAVVFSSGAITGSVTGIIERTVHAVRVTGMRVADTDVHQHTDD